MKLLTSAGHVALPQSAVHAVGHELHHLRSVLRGGLDVAAQAALDLRDADVGAAGDEDFGSGLHEAFVALGVHAQDAADETDAAGVAGNLELELELGAVAVGGHRQVQHERDAFEHRGGRTLVVLLDLAGGLVDHDRFLRAGGTQLEPGQEGEPLVRLGDEPLHARHAANTVGVFGDGARVVGDGVRDDPRFRRGLHRGDERDGLVELGIRDDAAVLRLLAALDGTAALERGVLQQQLLDVLLRAALPGELALCRALSERGQIHEAAHGSHAAGRAARVLHHVRQLVREEVLTGGIVRCEVARLEEHVGADRERLGLQRARQPIGATTVVDAHAAEVGAERLLQRCPNPGIERAAAGGTDGSFGVGGDGLPAERVGGGLAGTAQRRHGQPALHLFGRAVGRGLVRVVGTADYQPADGSGRGCRSNRRL
jgi:hypothetical protein